MTGWRFSDAWVFSALAGGPENGCSLCQIVACADAINHAILLEAEFVHAVPRLLAADLMGADPGADRYWLTDAGRELYATRMRHRGLFGWIEAILPALVGLGEPQNADWVLDPGVFDAAVREYSGPSKRGPKPS
jgi:hypothetical protein